MIELTNKAVEKLKEFGEAEGLPLIVRIKILGGGCAGFSNDMSFEDNISDLDEVIEQDDVKIVVDQLSIQYLQGTIIDYIDADFGAGFKFNVPNSKSSCGCGKSYSF